ncbi:hypothetical protein D3C81_1859360 [compost metagenome]
MGALVIFVRYSIAVCIREDRMLRRFQFRCTDSRKFGILRIIFLTIVIAATLAKCTGTDTKSDKKCRFTLL